LKGNLISESSPVGIRFKNAATGNSVKGNILASNLTGIEFRVTPPAGPSVGNELKGERIDRERMRTVRRDRRQADSQD
jgi:hypothetical protein